MFNSLLTSSTYQIYLSTMSATMSTGFILLNSKGQEIEQLDISIDTSFDTDISNQPYDYSSPVKDEERPSFMTPKPVSPKRTFVFGSGQPFKFDFVAPLKLERQTNQKVLSVLGKRKYKDAFGDTFDDDRYGQHIYNGFFTFQYGHGVFDKPLDKEWDNYVFNEGKRERDSESKYDPEEILTWCYKYLADKKKNN